MFHGFGNFTCACADNEALQEMRKDFPTRRVSLFLRACRFTISLYYHVEQLEGKNFGKFSRFVRDSLIFSRKFEKLFYSRGMNKFLGDEVRGEGIFEIKETAVSGTSLGGNCIITHNLGLIWQKSIFDGVTGSIGRICPCSH